MDGMHRQKPLFIAAGVALALTLAGAAVAAVAARSSAAAATVKVTESEYHIRLSPSSVHGGTVTLVVHNAGKIAHQLDLAGGGHRTIAVGTIAPGATRTKTVKLAGGTISLWCPIPGHAALGMKASLHVAGAAAATTTSGSAWG